MTAWQGATGRRATGDGQQATGRIDPGLLLVAETVDAAQEQADADTCDGGRSQFGNG